MATTKPVGTCVTRTAESVVFTDWPPGPDARKTSICRSDSSIRTSTSLASGSTDTVADDVCTRPCDSVTGTRCTRCVPASCFMRVHTWSPAISPLTSVYPPRSDGEAASGSSFQRRRRAKA